MPVHYYVQQAVGLLDVSFRFCSRNNSSSPSRSVHDIGKSVNMFLKGVGWAWGGSLRMYCMHN